MEKMKDDHKRIANLMTENLEEVLKDFDNFESEDEFNKRKAFHRNGGNYKKDIADKALRTKKLKK